MPKAYSGQRQEMLGEELRQRRVLLEISLDEISQKTGIPIKYIKRLERSDWGNLPGEVYTKGMLRRYSRTLGENSDKIIARYGKEFSFTKNLDIVRKPSRASLVKSFFSPKITRRTVLFVVMIMVLGYIAWQLSPVLARPNLSILAPASEETIVFEDSVVLEGRTEPGTSVFLNDQAIAISSEGGFKETVELLPGLNVLEVKAVSRFGKESTIERKIIYQEN